MRKIYGSDKDGVKIAWIGESAPVPDGWSTDINQIQVKTETVSKQDEKTLTEDDLKELVLASPELSNGELAKELGIHWKQVQKIRKEAE